MAFFFFSIRSWIEYDVLLTCQWIQHIWLCYPSRSFIIPVPLYLWCGCSWSDYSNLNCKGSRLNCWKGPSSALNVGLPISAGWDAGKVKRWTSLTLKCDYSDHCWTKMETSSECVTNVTNQLPRSLLWAGEYEWSVLVWIVPSNRSRTEWLLFLKIMLSAIHMSLSRIQSMDIIFTLVVGSTFSLHLVNVFRCLSRTKGRPIGL